MTLPQMNWTTLIKYVCLCGANKKVKTGKYQLLTVMANLNPCFLISINVNSTA